jgi:hypothetical protein
MTHLTAQKPNRVSAKPLEYIAKSGVPLARVYRKEHLHDDPIHKRTR